MKIALVTQREDLNQYGVPIDIMESTYIEFLNNLGYTTLPVSNYESRPEELFDIIGVELLVLTGGGSLPAKYYKGDYGYAEQSYRDKLEERLMVTAFTKNVAILAICRGMQFVNGYFGGKISNLNDLPAPRKNGDDHLVLWDNSKPMYVNNYHNDGIYLDDLTKQAGAPAIDVENGTVEAFAIREKKLLALQWHPERQFKDEVSREKSTRIIKEFLMSIEEK